MNKKILTYFGFTRMPFAKEIPIEDIFRSKMINGLLGMFELGIPTEDIMLIFGKIGSGKTVALRLFMESLDSSKYYPLYLKSSGMNITDLYKSILCGMKIEPPSRLYGVRRLYEKVIPESRKKPVIILDDAQELTDEALLELKNLVSFDADSKNRLCVIISGQLEIADKLAFSLFTPLMQRIRLQYMSTSMDLEETCRYIDHQLHISGRESAIFTDDTKSEIFKRTNGTARLVNKECYKALISACTKEKELVEPSILPPPDSRE